MARGLDNTDPSGPLPLGGHLSPISEADQFLGLKLTKPIFDLINNMITLCNSC